MKIIIDISHPAHVHFFRYAYHIWQEHGHQVKLVARDKDVTLKLLDDYGYPYTVLSKKGSGLTGLSMELLTHANKLFKLAKDFKADVIVEIGGTFIVHVCKLLGIKGIVFTDTEHASISNAITFPFATKIVTPESYRDDLGKKQVRYNGYQELAYLHPNYFKPDPESLAASGLQEGEKFYIVRFVSWGASHDVGKLGLSDEQKIRLVSGLNQHGKVLITSEGNLPAELEPYKVRVSPTKIHDLMYYASMYVGEGATMASESAILGTPSVYINPLGSGNLDEIIHKYQLMYHYADGDPAIEKALELANLPDLKAEFRAKCKVMIDDKTDVTAWMVNYIESLAEQKSSKS